MHAETRSSIWGTAFRTESTGDLETHTWPKCHVFIQLHMWSPRLLPIIPSMDVKDEQEMCVY